MMDDLLRQHESKTLDFKRDFSSPRGVLKTLVAFANSAGGRVVLGAAASSAFFRQQELPDPGITEIATGLRFTVWLKESVRVEGASDLPQQATASKNPTRTHQVPHK